MRGLNGRKDISFSTAYTTVTTEEVERLQIEYIND